MKKETTDQVTPPELRNPTGRGGFGEHPENRSNGTWDSTQSISHQYKMLMRMTLAGLYIWAKDNEKTMTVAQRIAYNRLLAAQKSLADVREITDRTEGKAPQNIDVTTGGQALTPIVVEFIDKKE